MSTLRDYQIKLSTDIDHCIKDNARSILAVMPTGGGKTIVMSEQNRKYGHQWSLNIAHRQELTGQISKALALMGIYHRIIAPDKVIAYIISSHISDPRIGRSFVDHRAPAAVAGVDTLIRRGFDRAENMSLVQIDEGHHVVIGNKWHRALSLFRNALLIAWTATPNRADRKPLGSEYGGVFDRLVVGPTATELMRRNYLVPVDFYGPPPSIDRRDLIIGDSGEFTQKSQSEAARRSQIVGDMVSHYRKLAPGLTMLMFATDVKMADNHSAAFNAAGIRAKVITDKMDAELRGGIFRELETRQIDVLVNVNIAGEGTDLPTVGAVGMARLTESFSFFAQMVGRVTRPAPGKRRGIVIDAVGNFAAMTEKYGYLFDIEWTDACLEGGRKLLGARADPVRQCTNPGCWRQFMSYSLRCPFCGHMPPVTPARSPEEVEGDLVYFDPALIAELRRKADDAIRVPNGPMRTPKDLAVRDNMLARCDAQIELRDCMAWWRGIAQAYRDEDDSASARRFYRQFGVDAMTARGLAGPDARRLTRLIREEIGA